MLWKIVESRILIDRRGSHFYSTFTAIWQIISIFCIKPLAIPTHRKFLEQCKQGFDNIAYNLRNGVFKKSTLLWNYFWLNWSYLKPLNMFWYQISTSTHFNIWSFSVLWLVMILLEMWKEHRMLDYVHYKFVQENTGLISLSEFKFQNSQVLRYVYSPWNKFILRISDHRMNHIQQSFQMVMLTISLKLFNIFLDDVLNYQEVYFVSTVISLL